METFIISIYLESTFDQGLSFIMTYHGSSLHYTSNTTRVCTKYGELRLGQIRFREEMIAKTF